MNGCTVTFEGDHGDTYEVAANMVGYIDSNLINTGYSGTIYLYPSGQVASQGNRSAYIALQQNSYPRYYTSSGYGYTEITNAHNVTFNTQSLLMRNKEYIDYGVSFLLSLFCLCKIFSR